MVMLVLRYATFSGNAIFRVNANGNNATETADYIFLKNKCSQFLGSPAAPTQLKLHATEDDVTITWKNRDNDQVVGHIIQYKKRGGKGFINHFIAS